MTKLVVAQGSQLSIPAKSSVGCNPCHVLRAYWWHHAKVQSQHQWSDDIQQPGHWTQYQLSCSGLSSTIHEVRCDTISTLSINQKTKCKFLMEVHPNAFRLFYSTFMSYLPVLEPIGGSKPKFSIVTDIIGVTHGHLESLDLHCPAQGSPVPTFRSFSKSLDSTLLASVTSDNPQSSMVPIPS